MTFNQAQENFSVNRGLSELPANEITKLKLEGNIVLGNFIFNTIDEDGVVWVITDIKGWWSPPDADSPSVQRGFGDGSYDVRGRYNERNISLEGTILTPRPELIEPARDKLISALDLVYKGAWLKTGTNPIRASWVRRVGSVDIQTINSRGRTNFQVELKAPDPIKYLWNSFDPEGYEVVELLAKSSLIPGSGSVSITNLGNYPVPVYFEVSGPVVGPATIFNRTREELIIITQGFRGREALRVVNKQLIFDVNVLQDVATLTTLGEHSFRVGDLVLVSNAGEEFDGERIITSTPTSTTFTFEGESAIFRAVNNKTLQSGLGLATLETTENHGFSAGDEIIVSGVDAVFDGAYTVVDTPTSNSLRYQRARQLFTSVSGKVLVSNIATLSTPNSHFLVPGDRITVSGVDINFDGEYEVLSIPSSTQVSYAATRTNARNITNRVMSNDIATLTTSEAHGFVIDEGVNVSNVGLSFNGGFRVQSIPTPTTFTYERPRATRQTIFIRSRTSNVATLATTVPHGLAVGEIVILTGVGTGYDGTRTITTIPSPNTLTFASTGTNEIATAVQSGSMKSRSRKILNRDLVANLATILTVGTHGVFVGETVTITGLSPSLFNGTYTVVSVPSPVTFTYSKVNANIPPLDLSQEGVSPPANAFVEMSGNIASSALSPVGLATVSGSLPFSTANGSVTVGPDIERKLAAGKIIKPNDVRFTSDLATATAVLDADLLEIDTDTREVFFNGEAEGARGKIDVLADFIRLDPGENTIEFEDSGASESESSIKISYRSGWLG
jgi:DNA/RNA endonuclease YhcR with UshA esterase domain